MEGRIRRLSHCSSSLGSVLLRIELVLVAVIAFLLIWVALHGTQSGAIGHMGRTAIAYAEHRLDASSATHFHNPLKILLPVEHVPEHVRRSDGVQVTPKRTSAFHKSTKLLCFSSDAACRFVDVEVRVPSSRGLSMSPTESHDFSPLPGYEGSIPYALPPPPFSC